MNWKRYQALIISGVLSLILLLAALFWMRSSMQKARDLDMEIQSLTGEQSRLTGQDLYPSSETVQSLQASKDALQERRDKWILALVDGQAEAPRLNRSVFGDHVKSLVERLRAKAKASTKGGENGVILRDRSFGLQDYLEGTLPESTEIPRLVLEMELMEASLNILFDHGISELVDIELTTPEEEAEENAAGNNPAGGMFGSALPGLGARPQFGVQTEEADKGLSEAEIKRDELFSYVDVSMTFRAYEDSLKDILNRVAATPHQVVMRGLEFSNSNAELWPPQTEAGRTGPSVIDTNTRGGRAPRNRPRGRQRLDALMGMMEGVPGAPDESEEVMDKLPGLKDRRLMVTQGTGGELINVALDVRIYRYMGEVPDAPDAPEATAAPAAAAVSTEPGTEAN